MIFELGDNKWLICTNEMVSQADIEERAGVRSGTYAADLVNRLHRQIFEKSINLKGDYLTYFKPEYKSFKRFLQVRFDFSDEVVQEADALFSDYQYIFCMSLFSFFEDEGCKQVLKVLFPK